MGMLAAGGLDTVVDGLRGADDDNPKGYHELERVKELDMANRIIVQGLNSGFFI